MKTDTRTDRTARWRARCHCGWCGEWRKRLETANREMRRHRDTHPRTEGETFTEGHPGTAEFKDNMPSAIGQHPRDNSELFAEGDHVMLVHTPDAEWIHDVPLPAAGRVIASAPGIKGWRAWFVRLNATGQAVHVRATRMRRRSIVDAIGDLDG